MVESPIYYVSLLHYTQPRSRRTQAQALLLYPIPTLSTQNTSRRWKMGIDSSDLQQSPQNPICKANQQKTVTLAWYISSVRKRPQRPKSQKEANLGPPNFESSTGP